MTSSPSDAAGSSFQDSHKRGDEATTTVEARGCPDLCTTARREREGAARVGRAAGALLTGQRQDGPSQVPVTRGSTPGPLTEARGSNFSSDAVVPMPRRSQGAVPPAPTQTRAEGPHASIALGAGASSSRYIGKRECEAAVLIGQLTEIAIAAAHAGLRGDERRHDPYLETARRLGNATMAAAR